MIRAIRRFLLRVAMWRDKEAEYTDANMSAARAIYQSARDGCIEDEIRIERAIVAHRYILGKRS